MAPKPVPVVLVDPRPPHIKRAQEWIDEVRAERDSSPLVYERGGAHSYMMDKISIELNSDPNGEAWSRMQAHGRQVNDHPRFSEYRAVNATQGTGGFGVPPAWLEHDFVALARQGRPAANAASNFALPEGTNQLNVPRLVSGSSVSAQATQNTNVSQTDLTDASIVCPVVTVSGQANLSQQLLDQSPAEFDEFVLGDLGNAYATQIDSQLLAGAGTGGTLQGLVKTPGIFTVAASNTIQSFYSGVSTAQNQILTSRFLPPDCLVMHPRRFSWLCSLQDSADRPLFLPHIPRPAGDAGVLTDVASENVAASLFNLPIILDANVPTNSGGSGDYVFVLRAKDIALWESDVRTRVARQTLGGQLTVVCSFWRYAAVGVRYASSVALVGPMPAPTLGS